MLILDLDPDIVGHLAFAIQYWRLKLEKAGWAEPPELAGIHEALTASVRKSQERSGAITVPIVLDDDLRDREYLSPDDVARIAGVGIATVRRWLRNGKLPSTQHGRLRRIHRPDLDALLRVNRPRFGAASFCG